MNIDIKWILRSLIKSILWLKGIKLELYSKILTCITVVSLISPQCGNLDVHHHGTPPPLSHRYLTQTKSFLHYFSFCPLLFLPPQYSFLIYYHRYIFWSTFLSHTNKSFFRYWFKLCYLFSNNSTLMTRRRWYKPN